MKKEKIIDRNLSHSFFVLVKLLLSSVYHVLFLFFLMYQSPCFFVLSLFFLCIFVFQILIYFFLRKNKL